LDVIRSFFLEGEKGEMIRRRSLGILGAWEPGFSYRKEVKGLKKVF
jgi:hypothetical protein